MTETDLQVKALLITQAGQHGEARRALLGQLVERLQGWPERPHQPYPHNRPHHSDDPSGSGF